jgi:hypothetical protein
MLQVEYDEAYEHGLFSLRKSRKKAATWQPGPIADEETLKAARAWFFELRKRVTNRKMNKIVSSRLAKRLVSALLAGIPMDEAKADLLLNWTTDEIAKVSAA